MAVDLSSLPTPTVIEEVSYEAIVQRKKDKFKELWEAVRLTHPELPDYDVQMLETDPVVILLEADAYDELLLRALANSAAKSNLLAFSTGANLDNLAADHSVTRLTGESDEALRERIILADQASSSAGPEEWYKFHARSADVNVEDVAVYRPGNGPQLTIAILARNNGGVPSPAMLQAVRDVVNSPLIRSMNDIITVVAATNTTVNVSAGIWLLPDTPMSVFDGLDEALSKAFDDYAGLGFDINQSWLVAKLMVAGVSKVEIYAPTTDTTINGNSAATLGTADLQFKGRSR